VIQAQVDSINHDPGEHKPTVRTPPRCSTRTAFRPPAHCSRASEGLARTT